MRTDKNKSEDIRIIRERIKSSKTEGYEALIPSENVWKNLAKIQKQEKKKKTRLFGFIFLFILFGSGVLIQSVLTDKDLSKIPNELSSTSDTESNTDKLLNSTVFQPNNVKVNTEVFNNEKTKPQDEYSVIESKGGIFKTGIVLPTNQLVPRSNFANSTNPSAFDFDINLGSTGFNLDKSKTVDIIELPSKSEILSSNLLDINNLATLWLLSPFENNREYKPLTLNGFSNVENKKTNLGKRWLLSIDISSNFTDYQIEDLGLDERVNFNLQGSIGRTVSLNVAREISENIYITTGFGMNTNPFQAKYDIALDDYKPIVTADINGTNLDYGFIIPSLAGGINANLDLRASTEDNTNVSTYLNLGHSYKTIYVPIGLMIIKNISNDLSYECSSNFNFSKRLPSIETKVDELLLDSDEFQISDVELSVVNRQVDPFRTYNIEYQLGSSLNYSINSAIMIGIRASVNRPLFSIYNDDNLVVRTYRYELGLNTSFLF